MRFVDRTGQKFDRLTVVRVCEKEPKDKQYFWECLCVCGNITKVSGGNLQSGGTKSCGCLCKENTSKSNSKDLTNKKFGRLLATGIINKPKSRNRENLWLCKCDCGIFSEVKTSDLLSGNTKSCGCLSAEMTSKRCVKDLNGMQFGNLKVLERDKSKNNWKAYWKCLCVCGKIISVETSSLRKITKFSNFKSCGCCNPFHQKGQNNPRWKSEISEDERKKSKNRLLCEGMKDWRNRVMQRDKYTCQISGIKSKNLCVHHLESWHSNEKLRVTDSNGVTLNSKVHNLFHQIYGRKNNTKFQFDEFVDRFKKHEFII